MAFTVGTNFRGVNLLKQSAFNTPLNVSGTLAGCAFGMVDDESFRGVYDIIERNDMSNPVVSQTVRGKFYSEGSVNMALDNSEFAARILSGIFPMDTVSTPTGSVKLHTMTPINHANGYNASATYPVFTIYVMRDERMHLYPSMSVNRVSLSASVGEYVSMSADLVGMAPGSHASNDGSAIEAATIAAFASNGEGPHNQEPIHFVNSKIYFANNATASQIVSSFDVEFNLNRDIDGSYGLGSDTCVRAPPPQKLSVTGNIEFMRPTSSGGSTNNSPLDEPDMDSLLDTAAGSLSNPGSGNDAIKLEFGTGNELITLEMYSLRFGAPESNLSGRDTQTMRIPFTALYDNEDANLVAQLLIKTDAPTKNSGHLGWPSTTAVDLG